MEASYSQATDLSTQRPQGGRESTPAALVCWPNGLDGPVMIVPNGGSEEVDMAIVNRLEGAFSPVLLHRAA